MAAVLTVLFIVCFNAFAFHTAAADFHHLRQVTSKAQAWEPSLAGGSWVCTPTLPEQRHCTWRIPQLEAMCGSASFWTLDIVMGHD